MNSILHSKNSFSISLLLSDCLSFRFLPLKTLISFVKAFYFDRIELFFYFVTQHTIRYPFNVYGWLLFIQLYKAVIEKKETLSSLLINNLFYFISIKINNIE